MHPDPEQWKRDHWYIAPTHEEAWRASHLGMPATAVLTERALQADREHHEQMLAMTIEHGRRMLQGRFVPGDVSARRAPLFARLCRLFGNLCVLAGIVMAMLFAIPVTRPIPYLALAALAGTPAQTGWSLDDAALERHVRSRVPGLARRSVREEARILHRAPTDWNRMTQAQRSVVAGMHLRLSPGQYRLDALPYDHPRADYLARALPSYLSAYAKDDPTYARLLADFHWHRRNLPAAIAALEQGSAGHLPQGRAKLSNFLLLKARQGQLANRNRSRR